MRKQFFLLTLLLCLCVNNAWGTDVTFAWRGEVAFATQMTADGNHVGEKSAEFYLYNAESKMWVGTSGTTPKTYSSSASATRFQVEIYDHQVAVHYYKKGLITYLGGNTKYYLQNSKGTASYRTSENDNETNFNTWNPGNTSSFPNSYIISCEATNGGTFEDNRKMASAGDGETLSFPKNNYPSNHNAWYQISVDQFTYRPLLTNLYNDYDDYADAGRSDDEVTALNTALTNANTELAATPAVGANIKTKYNALNTAVNNYLTMVATYKSNLQDAIDAANITKTTGTAALSTYQAAIDAAQDVANSTTSATAYENAQNTLADATAAFLSANYAAAVSTLTATINSAKEVTVQFTTLANKISEGESAIEAGESSYGATALLSINETLLAYISVATGLIGSDEYSAYSTKHSDAEALAEANEVNTYFDNALNTAISTAESDLLAVRLSSLDDGKADISTINGNIDAAVSAYNAAITSKNNYLEKRIIALDLSDNVPTATGLNDMLTSLVETENAAVAGASTTSAIDVATTALNNAISTYNEALPRYNFALQQVDVAGRSGYDASSNLSAINACTSASEINSAIATLRTAAKTYITTNATAGMDMTIFIENNSFESGTTEGWTLSGTSGDTGVKSQSNLTYATENCDGYYLFNTWNEIDYKIMGIHSDYFYEGETITQTVSGLPNGYYRISTLVTSDNNNSILLQVNENEPVSATADDKNTFNRISYVFQKEGDNITIKIKGEEKTYGVNNKYNVWYKADNITLQFLGANPYQSYAMNIIANSSIEGFNKSSYASTISGTTDEDAITSALNSFRSDAINHIITNSIVGQDVTFLLENPDFEYLADWNYRWNGTNDEENDGDKKTMSAYQRKVDGSNTYAWMHRQNSGTSERTLNAGNIYQAITLPAGTYKVTSDIEATSNDNNAGVIVTFYVKNGETILASKDIAMTRNSSFNNQALIFSLTEETTVTIGASHSSVKNSSRKTVAVDNFKLYYWETAKTKALIDGYAMLYSSTKNIRVNDVEAKVYSATWNEDAENPVITLNEDPFGGASERIIEAGKVVLIYNSTKPATLSYSHTAADATDAITDNLFVHHNGNTTGFTNYVLGKKDGENVAFHLFTGAESALANYNVLQLPISPSPAPSAISIVTEGNTATALVPVYEDNSAIAGQKANGKKILIEGRLYIQQGNNLYDALGRKVQ